MDADPETVLERSGANWARVRGDNGQEGWVPSPYVAHEPSDVDDQARSAAARTYSIDTALPIGRVAVRSLGDGTRESPSIAWRFVGSDTSGLKWLA